MSTPLKPVLSCGLGQYASSDAAGVAAFGPDASGKAKEMLAVAKQKAEESGFELVMCDANPQDPEDTMKRLRETLESRDFVAVNIGFGLRGHKGEWQVFGGRVGGDGQDATADLGVRTQRSVRENGERGREDQAGDQDSVLFWALRYHQLHKPQRVVKNRQRGCTHGKFLALLPTSTFSFWPISLHCIYQD